ncbi:YwqJ-related putative deaminase [Streptacidiphilus cavernicola]|uniref:YwqJ-related putative deaminase n=1 Tax=Streptacidiphilus cavernicola TaxID=3342716 RepID=A0ABV6VN37_9ACTN
MDHTTDDRRPATVSSAAPLLRERRDSLMPVVAAALSLRGGETHTCAGEKTDRAPELHPLVETFLDGLPTDARERFTGRCPEAVLLSQFFRTVEDNRSRRAARRIFTEGDARKALRGARLTTVRIREEGDPAHGTHQPPCRSCEPMLAHFGVETVALASSASSAGQG